MLFAIGSLGGGGSERQVLTILHHLDRSRFEPYLYLIRRQGEWLDHVPDDVPVTAFDDRSHRPRGIWPGRIHHMQVEDMAGVIRELSIDVVYDRTYFMTLISAPATRRCGVPRISAIVSSPRQDLNDTAGRLMWVKRRLLKRAYRSAARVTANSEGLRQEAIAYYCPPPEQVVVAHNILDLERIGRLSREPAPPFAPTRFHIVTAGRLHPAKGQQYLLAAVEELVHRRRKEQVRLHILGGGELDAELREFVRSHRLGDFVEMAGFVPNPYPYFRAADLFCLPSLYEGLPNVLLEAMACEVPVLSTDCPSGPREILAGGQYGRLVPPADATALADAIEEALGRTDRRQEVVAAARAHVEQTYSPTAGMERLESLLLAACHG